MCEPVIYDEPVLEFLENNMAKKLEGFIEENKIPRDFRLRNGKTLPQYAVMTGNEGA